MTKKLGIILASLAAIAIVSVGAMSYACDGSSCKNKTASVKTASAGATCDPSKCNAKTADGKCDMSKCTQTAGGATCDHSKCTSTAQTAGALSGCSAQSATTASTGCSAHGATTASTGCSAKSAGAGCCAGKGASMTSGGGCTMSKNSSMASACGSKGYYGANVYDVKDGKQWAVYKGKKFEVTDATPYTQVESARYYFADNECAVKCTETLKSMAADIEKETVALATLEGNIVEEKDGVKYANCSGCKEKFAVTEKSAIRMMDGKKVYYCCDGCAGREMSTVKTANYEKVN